MQNGNDEPVQFNTLLPTSLRRKIKVLAVKQGRTMHALIQEVLWSYVTTQEDQPDA